MQTAAKDIPAGVRIVACPPSTGFDRGIQRSRIIDGAKNASDAIVFVSTNPNDRWNLLGYLLAGFNDAAPDYGLGGAATYKF